MSSLWIILPVAAFLAAISDYCSCLWQANLRLGLLNRLASMAGVLEAITWIPLALAIEIGDGWSIAGASIFGAMIGSRLGGRKYSKAIVGNSETSSSSPSLDDGLGCDGEDTIVRHS